MNEFKESLKVSEEELYKKHNKDRYEREINKKKWENAIKRIREEGYYDWEGMR